MVVINSVRPATRAYAEDFTAPVAGAIRLPDHRKARLTLMGAARRLTDPSGIQRWILHRLQQLPDVAELT